MAITIQRKRETWFLSNQAASAVASMGDSITMAVNSPTGKCCKPKKAQALLVSKSTPRSI